MTLTRETIHDIVRSLNCGDAYDAYERANQATDEIWDLVEPTVREVWQAAWESCCLRSGVGRDGALSDYRSEADHG